MRVVETSYGKIQGVAEGGLCVFRGIPYARAPIGARRFQAPEPPERWAGVRAASRFGAAAPQNPSLLGPMLGLDVGATNEDCLFLNVWTPGCDDARRPVMVWIHGGAFVMGAGSQTIYEGATLARRGDLVVVTINYRLGALGFLNFRDVCGEALPATANAGLLDQIAALEWVRNEIGAFGGDPNEVTVFGESAGAISVATLLGTPRARGVFRRAIPQSGSANFAAAREQGARVADAFLKTLELTPATAGRLLGLPVTTVLEAQQRCFLELQGKLSGLPFAPIVDGEVLPRHPFAAIRDGSARDTALLIGTNLDEMKLFGMMDPAARRLDEAALLRRCERLVPGHAERAVETYRGARQGRGAEVTPPALWFAIDSDRAFRYPAMRLAELHRTHQPDTYAYLFTWPSPFMNGALGACHALELPFVFGTLSDPMLMNLTGTGAAAHRLAERIQEAWISFARSGQPSADWPAYDPAQRATMLINDEWEVAHAPLEAERRFWETVS